MAALTCHSWLTSMESSLYLKSNRGGIDGVGEGRGEGGTTRSKQKMGKCCENMKQN